ncbi:hypothetical protein V8C86DRAFT_625781 [Haematococcus lacustris]
MARTSVAGSCPLPAPLTHNLDGSSLSPARSCTHLAATCCPSLPSSLPCLSMLCPAAHMSSFVRRLAPVPIQPRPTPSPAGAAVPEFSRSAQLMLTPPTKTPALPSAAAWPHSPISVIPLTPGQTLRHRFPSPKASQAPAAGRQAAQADQATALGAAPHPCQGMAAEPSSSHSPSAHRGLQLQFSNHLADFHRQLQGQAGGAAEYGRQLCPEWPQGGQQHASRRTAQKQQEHPLESGTWAFQ